MRRTVHRTVLVYGTSVNLYAALREMIPADRADIFWAGPDELEALLEQIQPWPWAIVSDESDIPDALAAACRANPVITFWLKAAPEGLPASTIAHTRWKDLAGDIASRLDNSVAGLRLAPFKGVLLPDGTVLRSPALEALIGVFPGALPIPKSALKWARVVIAEQHLDVDVYYHGAVAGIRPATTKREAARASRA